MQGFFKFILIKIGFLIATYFIALLVAFILPRAVPGNPVNSVLIGLTQGGLTPEMLDYYQRTLMEVFELNKPWHVQFLSFVARMFTGDLGISTSSYGEKVIVMIARHIPWTLALIVPASIVSWLVGNLAGAWAAYRRGSASEKITLAMGMIVSQIPYYWLAMTLIFVFAVNLKLFPTGGAYDPTLVPSLSPRFILSALHSYVLPFLSIVIPSIGGWIVSMRVLASMELGSAYVGFSDSLGVRDEIVFRYILRNSMLPQVTGIGIQLGFVIAGQIVTEQIFTYPGMGILLARALGARDYPLIQGIFIILIASVLLANFVVDLIYVLIDPRIRLGHRST